MPYTKTTWVSGQTPLDAPELNNLEQQYDEASQSMQSGILGAFIKSGLVATKDGTTATKLDVTSGTAWLLQADNTVRRRSVAATSFTVGTPSTTYFLDLQSDGTCFWGTAHSGQANYLAICAVTTDASANIASVTDTRTLTPSLLAGAAGVPSLPGIQTTAPSTLDNGTITTDGLGTIAGKAPSAPAAPSATAASSGTPSATYANTVLGESGILRFYRMDAASGTTEADQKGGYTGTYAGGYTLGTSGLLTGDTDAAVTFNGSSGKLTSTTATGLPTGNGAASLEAWVKISSVPSATQVIAELGTHGTNTGLWLGLLNTGQIATGGNGAGTINASQAISLNVPHHIVLTWDGTTERLYVDGVLATSIAGNTMAWSYSGGALTVGSTSAATYYFNGVVDEVAAYSVALSASQVSTHYAIGTYGPDSLTKLGVGTYNYAVSFASTLGETALSPLAPAFTTAGNQQVTLSAIPTGPVGTMKRNVYRTPLPPPNGPGGMRYPTTPQLLTTLADNVTTSYTDAAPDSRLGVAFSAPTGGIAKWGGQATTGQFGVPLTVAQWLNQAVTTTTAVQLQWTPTATGLYRASGGCTINASGAPKITFQVIYTDPNNGTSTIAPFLVADSATLANGANALASGGHACLPVTFYAQVGFGITIQYVEPTSGASDHFSVIIERLA